MIQMKWRADSENSENSALDTIIVTHKIYEKKYFLIGLTLLRRIEQLNTLLVYHGIREFLPRTRQADTIEITVFWIKSE